jgi:hypothetical protein
MGWVQVGTGIGEAATGWLVRNKALGGGIG